jgi:protein tyrosine phosphatase
LELVEEHEKDAYTIRQFNLISKKEASAEPRAIYHFQFTNWPDFGVPEDSSNFRKFVEAVRDLDDSFEKQNAPIVAHCSAGKSILIPPNSTNFVGIGRSGTFVVSDILLTALRTGKTENLPLIDELVLHMRKFRMWLIQTPGQLRFCWLVTRI